MGGPSSYTVLVSAQKLSIKSIKTALEARGKFDKERKILHGWDAMTPGYFVMEDGFQADSGGVGECECLIPTTQSIDIMELSRIPSFLKSIRHGLAESLGLLPYISIIHFAILPRTPSPQSPSPKTNLLAQTLTTWLHSLPPSHFPSSPVPPTLPTTYTVYGSLLLLPPTTFARPPWPTLSTHLPSLYALLCKSLHITHIALSAPIPLLSEEAPSSPSATRNINTLRAPLALTPLYGSFGAPNLAASPDAFSTVFWVSTRQHGVFQTWAPLYTMFSRGNISEKARILEMATLGQEALGCEARETSAVDLYAGIGYFAFCYAKREVGRVLCWELSGWSVEGLKRGAERNGWGVRIVEGGEEGEGEGWEDRKDRLIVFREDNQRARERIGRMRGRIPPVRHVNCGFLPSSEGSWRTAVEVLDPEEGGWVHVHENIGVGDLETRKMEIVETFKGILVSDRSPVDRKAECQHLERVKSYAPGVLHCVLDIYIAPVARRAIISATPKVPD